MFCTISAHILGVLTADFQAGISWKLYTQILSSEIRAKYCFNNKWTLVILFSTSKVLVKNKSWSILFKLQCFYSFLDSFVPIESGQHLLMPITYSISFKIWISISTFKSRCKFGHWSKPDINLFSYLILHMGQYQQINCFNYRVIKKCQL